MIACFILHHKKIFLVFTALILSIWVLFFFFQKGEFETNCKNIITKELDIIFHAPQVTYKLTRCNIGEGNDSWVEFDLTIEVFSFDEVSISHRNFNMIFEPKQKYLIKGTASFEGNAYSNKWYFQKINLINTQ